MAKVSSIYVCQNCGFESSKWAGQCPNCGQWNTLVETTRSTTNNTKRSGGSGSSGPASVIRFSQVQNYDRTLKRLSSGMEEFDRVLGGGIVYGSVVLIGGEPGIGKSTLLTHLTLNIIKQFESEEKRTVLYVAGEESPEQISLRIQRMSEDMTVYRGQGTDDSRQSTDYSAETTRDGEKLSAFSLQLAEDAMGRQTAEGSKSDTVDWKGNLLFLTTTDVDEIVATIEVEKPDLVIVDSIQTLSTQDLTGATGSIGQLKESTDRLTRVAKRTNIPVFLVGHVTKEGSIAGPKVLEHMVDSVLELSGERTGQFRILRAVKNRFGATDEVGIFAHTDEGLIEVTNPSQAFLEERVIGTPGSAIVSVMEGTRPILVEVQALVVRSELPVPRRIARGIPVPKLQVIAAVLEKYCNLPLGQCDIFVNVAGGFSITEPSADLGLAVACLSSFKNLSLPKDTVYIGEVGLLGEVRKVKLLEKRVKECKRLGFQTIYDPSSIPTVKDALKVLFPREKSK